MNECNSQTEFSFYFQNSHESEEEVVAHLHKSCNLVFLSTTAGNGQMAACVPNAIKFHEVECSEELRFEPPVGFIPSITSSLGRNERALSPLIQIKDQEKEKYFLYNHIETVESCQWRIPKLKKIHPLTHHKYTHTEVSV